MLILSVVAQLGDALHVPRRPGTRHRQARPADPRHVRHLAGEHRRAVPARHGPRGVPLPAPHRRRPSPCRSALFLGVFCRSRRFRCWRDRPRTPGQRAGPRRAGPARRPQRPRRRRDLPHRTRRHHGRRRRAAALARAVRRRRCLGPDDLRDLRERLRRLDERAPGEPWTTRACWRTSSRAILLFFASTGMRTEIGLVSDLCSEYGLRRADRCPSRRTCGS